VISEPPTTNFQATASEGVITLVTAPGDGEVTVVPDETLGERDPLLAKLLAAATAGAAPAGLSTQRQPIRITEACAWPSRNRGRTAPRR
jgi:hypothetical protein